MSPKEVHAQEPRDLKWAPAVEARLNATVHADVARLVPEVGDIKIDCRTTMCQMKWDFASPLDGAERRESIAKVASVLRTLYGGSSGQMSAKEPEVVIAYTGGGPFANVERHDIDGLFAAIATVRKRRLDSARKIWRQTKRNAVHKGIDMDSLPTE